MGDDYAPQFLRIPNYPKMQKPKMSFYVSAPFEGQATVMNDSYIIRDTVIMRIDCEVFHTEYIGYGSQKDDDTHANNLENDVKSRKTDRSDIETDEDHANSSSMSSSNLLNST